MISGKLKLITVLLNIVSYIKLESYNGLRIKNMFAVDVVDEFQLISRN